MTSKKFNYKNILPHICTWVKSRSQIFAEFFWRSIKDTCLFYRSQIFSTSRSKKATKTITVISCELIFVGGGLSGYRLFLSSRTPEWRWKKKSSINEPWVVRIHKTKLPAKSWCTISSLFHLHTLTFFYFIFCYFFLCQNAKITFWWVEIEANVSHRIVKIISTRSAKHQPKRYFVRQLFRSQLNSNAATLPTIVSKAWTNIFGGDSSPSTSFLFAWLFASRSSAQLYLHFIYFVLRSAHESTRKLNSMNLCSADCKSPEERRAAKKINTQSRDSATLIYRRIVHIALQIYNYEIFFRRSESLL